jgi:hypothetical protein
MSIVTSAARPSAPRAAVAKLVAIEKKMIVPPSSHDRIAPCSQPGTSTQTTTSRRDAEGGVDGLREPTGSGVGERDVRETDALRVSACAGSHHAHGALGARTGQRATTTPLPAPPMTATVGASPLDVPADHPGGQGRSAADVHDHHRERAGQIVGHLGHDRAVEQDRVAVAGDLLAAAVPVAQLVVDDQRRQGERHQGRDLVADRELVVVAVGTDLLDDPDEHAPRSGHGVVHLAPCGRSRGLGAHGVAVAEVLVGQLAEARGVEVEALDPDADLPRVQVGAGVETPRRLRQHAARLEDSVQTDRAHRMTRAHAH